MDKKVEKQKNESVKVKNKDFKETIMTLKISRYLAFFFAFALIVTFFVGFAMSYYGFTIIIVTYMYQFLIGGLLLAFIFETFWVLEVYVKYIANKKQYAQLLFTKNLLDDKNRVVYSALVFNENKKEQLIGSSINDELSTSYPISMDYRSITKTLKNVVDQRGKEANDYVEGYINNLIKANMRDLEAEGNDITPLKHIAEGNFEEYVIVPKEHITN